MTRARALVWGHARITVRGRACPDDSLGPMPSILSFHVTLCLRPSVRAGTLSTTTSPSELGPRFRSLARPRRRPYPPPIDACAKSATCFEASLVFAVGETGGPALHRLHRSAWNEANRRTGWRCRALTPDQPVARALRVSRSGNARRRGKTRVASRGKNHAVNRLHTR